MLARENTLSSSPSLSSALAKGCLVLPSQGAGTGTLQFQALPVAEAAERWG